MKRTKVPVCAACGRKLRKYNHARDRTNAHLATRSRRHEVGDPLTLERLRRMTPEEYNAAALTGDGMEPLRGSDGNNVVCHQMCGHHLLVRLMLTLGTDVLALLPDRWRFRSS